MNNQNQDDGSFRQDSSSHSSDYCNLQNTNQDEFKNIQYNRQLRIQQMICINNDLNEQQLMEHLEEQQQRQFLLHSAYEKPQFLNDNQLQDHLQEIPGLLEAETQFPIAHPQVFSSYQIKKQMANRQEFIRKISLKQLQQIANANAGDERDVKCRQKIQQVGPLVIKNDTKQPKIQGFHLFPQQSDIQDECYDFEEKSQIKFQNQRSIIDNEDESQNHKSQYCIKGCIYGDFSQQRNEYGKFIQFRQQNPFFLDNISMQSHIEVSIELNQLVYDFDIFNHHGFDTQCSQLFVQEGINNQGESVNQQSPINIQNQSQRIISPQEYYLLFYDIDHEDSKKKYSDQ